MFLYTIELSNDYYQMILMNYQKEKSKKTILNHITKNKIPRNINLTRKVNHLYSKTYETLMKEIEDYVKKVKISCVHWLEELMLLK